MYTYKLGKISIIINWVKLVVIITLCKKAQTPPNHTGHTLEKFRIPKYFYDLHFHNEVRPLALSTFTWYNNRMVDEITVLDPVSPPSNIKRLIADAIRHGADQILYVAAMGRKMSYRQYLSIMIWDLLTNGEAFFADGKPLLMDEFDDWLSLSKFVAAHLDGTAQMDVAVTNLNVFKVYSNIDESKV